MLHPRDHHLADGHHDHDHGAASMTQQTPGSLSGSVDVSSIHRRAGDPFGLGGNYYGQVQNGDGQVDPRSSNDFTASVSALPR